jgi:TonB family protein
VFNVLIASGKTKTPRPVGGAVASMIAHGALLTAALLGSRPAFHAATEFEQQLAEYLFPKDRAPTTGDQSGADARWGGGSNSRASEGAKGAESRPKVVTKPHDSDMLQMQQPEGGAAAAPDPLAQQVAMAESMGAFVLLDVDSAAVRDPRSVAPSYPKDLEEKGIEGTVRMRFVVDSTGLVDLSTVKVLEKTNDAFAHAVRVAIPDMRFRPAYMAGKAVRQLSEEDFRFKVQVVRDTTGAKKKRKP